jgi:hypothetical protein
MAWVGYVDMLWYVVRECGEKEKGVELRDWGAV